MVDWYTEALAPQCYHWTEPGWVHAYAEFTGHFVDDFGTMVRVYAPDEVTGLHRIM